MNAVLPLIRLRVSGLRNSIMNVRKDSVAKSLVVIFGLGNVIGLGYWISLNSFRFIADFKAFGDLNAKMISLLLMALLVLVVLSTIIISSATLFRGKETAFLFQTPARPRAILLLKLTESIAISSWATLFLCLPVMVAYGVHENAPPLYYAEMASVMFIFVLFSGCLGALLAIILAPLFRRLSPKMLLLAALAVLVLLSWLFLRSFEFGTIEENRKNLLVLDRFASGFEVFRSPWSPSRWASTAISSAVHGTHGEVLSNTLTLLANTLIFLPLLSLYGKRYYNREWTAHQGSSSTLATVGSKSATTWRPGGSPMAALLRKDLLLFIRNPSQLAQSLLFLLLMVIYSLSLLQVPDFFKDSVNNFRLYRFIYFANQVAVCMIISSFTSRFIYPLLSLEGRAFWVIGLAPIPRRRLMTQKGVFAMAIILPLGLLTISISNLALRSPPEFFLSAVYTMILATLCLTSLSTGLGAAYPSFDESNPARIAVGLGGTLNFFASALTIAILVAIQSLPELLLAASPSVEKYSLLVRLAGYIVAGAFTLILSHAVLKMGERNLERCEF